MLTSPELSALATPPDGNLDAFLRSLQKAGDAAAPAPTADQPGSLLSNTHQGQSAPPTINDANRYGAASQDVRLEGATSGGAPVDAGAHAGETHSGTEPTPTEQPAEEQLVSARGRPPGATEGEPSVASNESVVSYPSSSPAALGSITRDPAPLQLPGNDVGTLAQGGAEVTTGSLAADTPTVQVETVLIPASPPTPPSEITVDGGSVAENAPAGTVVALLGAIDPDSTGSFTYALSSDPSGMFEVVGNEVRVKAGASLDFEAAASHQLGVTVTDATGLSLTQTLTITLTDVSEAPTGIAVTGGSVQENSPGGTVVATLQGVDQDAGSSFTYTLDADPSGMFELVGDEIRVKAGADLDYETQTSYDVTLSVTDASGLSHTENVTIAVTDESGTIVGTSGNDVLIGTSEEDTITGLGGNDFLDGRGRARRHERWLG
ncbi:MAG: cadherin domain-containing protein [Hyphomicrobium sp.]